jgi:thioredoxin-like negative regulator of GroEL
MTLHFHHDYAQAVQQYKKTLELDPSFVATRVQLVLSLLTQNKFDEATAELNQARTISPEATSITALLGYLYARTGRRKEALEILHTLTNTSKKTAPFDLTVL